MPFARHCWDAEKCVHRVGAFVGKRRCGGDKSNKQRVYQRTHVSLNENLNRLMAVLGAAFQQLSMGNMLLFFSTL